MGVYKRGGRWYARWWEGGRLRRKSLGPRVTDQAEAELWWKMFFADRPEEPPEPPSKRPPATVHDALERWLARVRVDRRELTWRAYRGHARRWQRRWGRLPLEQLTRERLLAWRDERLRQVGRSTLAKERSVLVAWLRWLGREGLLAEVPVLDPIPGVQRKRRRPAALEPQEVDTLLAVARDHHEPQVRALEAVVMLGAFAGLRRFETVALEWSDVDLEGASLTVREGKGGHEREVPIGPRLLEYLQRLRALRPDARFVAETPQYRQWEGSNVVSRWATRLWQAAALHQPGAPTLHALRHHYATELLRGGADLETVRSLLGHASVRTTEVYLSTTRDRQREAVAGF